MDLSKILSISGKRGLFRIVSQLKNAVLVESLIDQKRFPAFPHETISSLEEISVFTTGEELQLKDVFKTMFEKLEGKLAIDTKTDDTALRSFFQQIVPDYDPDKVYVSDMKKIIGWYNLLAEQKLLDFTEKEEEKKEPEAGVQEEKEPVEEKKKPAAGKKKNTRSGDIKTVKPSKEKKTATRSRSKKSEN